MAMWTSDRAIQRDLSLAQGGLPPTASRQELRPHPLGRNDRPPRLHAVEETAEEYLRGCVEKMDRASPETSPDLRLIQHMLKMMREQNNSEERNDDVSDIISEPNTHFLENIPVSDKAEQSKTCLSQVTLTRDSEQPQPMERKKKRQRNIALESILQALESKNSNDAMDVTGELLKPHDLTSTTYSQRAKDTENIPCSKKDSNKKDNWMKSMTAPIQVNQTKKRNTIRFNVNSMFKERKEESGSKSLLKNQLNKSTVQSKPKDSDGAYVLPDQVFQCYQRYLEKSEMMAAIPDDIWTKAEKDMKMIDLKRQNATERAALELAAEVDLPSEDMETTDLSVPVATLSGDKQPSTLKDKVPAESLAGVDVADEWFTPLQNPPGPSREPTAAVLQPGTTPVSWETLLSDSSD